MLGATNPLSMAPSITLREAMTWRPVLWFGLLALFLSFETWILGPYSYLPLHDTGDGQVPVFYTLARNALAHGVSYWYPNHVGGVDEEVTYSLFHLITPFFMFLPIWLAYGTILAIQHFLGGISMYAFCRLRFGLSRAASAIAGVAYTSPIIIMLGEHAAETWWRNNYFEYRLVWAFAIPALPLFLLAIDWAGERLTALKSALAGAALGVVLVLTMLLLAFWPYTLVVFGIYATVMARGRIIPRMILLISMAIVSALLQLDHIVAATYLYPESHRAVMDMPLGVPGNNQSSILDLLIAVFLVFVNVPALVEKFWQPSGVVFIMQVVPVVVIFCLVLFSPQRRARFWSGMAPIVLCPLLLCALIILGDNTRELVNQHLPKLFSRLDFNYTWGCGIKFFIVLGVAYIVHIAENEQGKWKRLCRAIVLAVVVLPIGYANLTYKAQSISHWSQNGSVFANYQSPQMVELKRSAGIDSPYRVVSIAYHRVSIHPNFVNPLGFESFDGYENLFPQSYGRFFLEAIGPEKELYLDRLIRPFIGRGRDQLHVVSNLLYLFYFSDKLNEMANLDLLALANVRYIISPIELDDDRLKLVSRPTSLAEKLKRMPEFAVWLYNYAFPRLQKIASRSKSISYHLDLMRQAIPVNFGGKDLYIYENPLALGRAFLARDQEIVAAGKVWDELAIRSLDDLKRRALVEKEASPQAASNESEARNDVEPRFTRYLADSYAIEGSASRASLLVVSHNYSKFWKAEINGKPVEGVRAYGTFMAFPVPSGNFKAVMKYEPPASSMRFGF